MIGGDDRHASVPFMLFVIDFLNAAHIYVLFFLYLGSRHTHYSCWFTVTLSFSDGISNLIFAVATGEVRW